MNPSNTFILVKPEGIVHLDYIKNYLKNNHYPIVSSNSIIGWQRMLHELYLPKSEYNRLELEAYAHTLQLLYPDKCDHAHYLEIAGLYDVLAKTEQLNNLKKEIRKQLDITSQVHITYALGEQNIPVYFNYIHVPDPEMSVIKKEKIILLGHD